MEDPITRTDQLEARFGEAGGASIRDEVDYLHPHYRACIEASPSAILETAGYGGSTLHPAAIRRGSCGSMTQKRC